jgi:hypothetical protein
MKFWRRLRVRGKPGGTPSIGLIEDSVIEAQVHVMATIQPANRDVAAGLDDVCRELQQTRLTVEVDDGINIPVVLSEQNAGMIVEATHRTREYREQEKQSLRPVYNFGNEGSWGGDG